MDLHIFLIHQTFPRFSPTCFARRILIYQKLVQIQVVQMFFLSRLDFVWQHIRFLLDPVYLTWKTSEGEARTNCASTSANFLRGFSVAFKLAIPCPAEPAEPAMTRLLLLELEVRRLLSVPLTSSSFSIRWIWSLKDAAWVRKDTRLAGWDSLGSELGSSTINALIKEEKRRW